VTSTQGSQPFVHERELAEYVDGLPNLSGEEARIAETIADAGPTTCPGFVATRRC